MENKIKKIKAREILDSRGNPTVEVELLTENGVFIDSVPSGASKGKYEAKELRDGAKRYRGKGVLKAVKNVNEIIEPKLKGRDVTRQKEIDEFLINLDGTENKSKLGVNAILGVSMAVCRAGAAAKNISLFNYLALLARNNSLLTLPFGCFNIINGGVHAGNELDFQEFMIVPQMKRFSENLQAASEIYHILKEILARNFGKSAINIGDEGGFAPPLRTPDEALNLIQEAIKKSEYKNKIKIILDVAASQFYLKEAYRTKMGAFTEKGLLNYYSDLIQKYPIIALEDPFSEEDWEGFWAITKKLGKKITIIGDDLLATNPKRIKEAQEKKVYPLGSQRDSFGACNGLLLKPNQIGTISEAIEAARLAKSYGWKIMVSHRSCETSDDFIADLAVGIKADYIKAGAPARGERVAKYNRLLKIEEEIKK